VGQSALSSGQRAATATVLADCRLLRFTEVDLERLTRRNPRIAAQVYRNLSHAQSDRIVALMNQVGPSRELAREFS
jgi:CRP-like cAMP-binding protein